MRTQIAAVIGIVVAGLTTEAGAATKFMDFNGDGYPDLAMAAPYATVESQVAAGTVTVIYGTVNGLNSGTGSQLWSQARTDVPGIPVAGGMFGHALEAADFNNDGYTDLAIGAPGEGAVIVLHGWWNGLKGERGSFCTVPCHPKPKVFRMPSPQPGDQFGYALASGRFNNDDFADLAVGAPGHSPGGWGFPPEMGAVRVLYSYDASGLTENGSYTFTLNMLSGWQETRDHFGASLAAGNFGKSGHDDLAIGIPDKKETTAPYGYGAGGGAVSVVYGSSYGLSALTNSDGGGNDYWIQNFTPWPEWEPGDKFGYALAAGHFGSGPYDDLAIGIPGKTVIGLTSAGAVTVLRGGASGLTTINSQQWTSANLPGSVRHGANFGKSLAAGNFGVGGGDDLAIGIPYYAVNGVTGSGLVTLVFSNGSDLVLANSKYIYQASGRENAHFGFSLSVAYLGGDGFGDLAIGVPNWPNAGIQHGGAVAIRYGDWPGPSATANSVFWTQDTLPGVSEEQAGFGFALSR